MDKKDAYAAAINEIRPEHFSTMKSSFQKLVEANPDLHAKLSKDHPVKLEQMKREMDDKDFRERIEVSNQKLA